MILDDERLIARYDAGNVRASIESLPDQIDVAWNEAKRIRVPAAYKSCDQIVVAGMGGSTLGAHLIQSVYGDAIKAPFYFVNGYELPGSVGRRSLVILSSYSGTTEETLSCFKDAKARGAKIMGIASGGLLAKLLRNAKAPTYIFDPAHNPSGQPRMGLGYMTMGLLALLNSVGALKVRSAEIEKIVMRLRALVAEWSIEMPFKKNLAKIFAAALKGTIPVIVGAEHLAANAHIFQNQIHESAKQFCVAFPLPELNHHLMEGLKYPDGLQRCLTFVFLSSELYSRRLGRRMGITEQVVKRQSCGFDSFLAAEPTRLGQAMETLAFASWVSFYMAMQNRVNPSNIPWVNFFKKQLSRG